MMNPSTPLLRRCGIGTFLSMIAALSSAGAADAAPPKSDPATEAIAMENKILKAVNAGDKEALAAFLADDFIQMHSRGRESKADILKTITITEGPLPKIYDMKAQLLAPDVVNVTYRMGGEEMEADVQWLSSVWVRRDGRWLNVFSQHSSPISAAPAVP